MQHGFIKVAAASPEIRVGDVSFNAGSILSACRQASADGVRLIVFPELCLSGATCGDLFYQKLLSDSCAEQLLKIAGLCGETEMLIVLGTPVSSGDRLYNCAALLYRGEILGIVPKTHLSNRGESYEKRYFTPAESEPREIILGGRACRFGAELLFCPRNMPEFCLGVELGDGFGTPAAPSVFLCGAGATVIANPSAGGEYAGQAAGRRRRIKAVSESLLCGYIHAGAGEGESTGDLVFAGHTIICENGGILAENKPFSGDMAKSELDVNRIRAERRKTGLYFSDGENGALSVRGKNGTFSPYRGNTGIPSGNGGNGAFSGGGGERYERVFFDLPVLKTALTRAIDPHPFVPSSDEAKSRRCEEIFAVQANGLKQRLRHTGQKHLLIGVSGGLDSCLALLVCARAMDLLSRPRSDIIAVTMPCFGTTPRTENNAALLCEQLSVTLRRIDISKSVLSHFEDIGQDVSRRDITYENAQARERTQVLMDLANMHGGIVVGTGNLSELALGFTTYNGDHMSMYGVNASVPKTLMRHMVRHASQTTKDPALSAILEDILTTPVSPELLPPDKGEISQKTEDIIGPYELHDFFLYYFVRFGFPPEKIYRLARNAFGASYGDSDIKKWLDLFLTRFFSQQFKRSCIPDGPKVGSVSLSPRGDWRMPSDASDRLWRENINGRSEGDE